MEPGLYFFTTVELNFGISFLKQYNFMYSQPSVSAGSTSVDSTSCRQKIFGKKPCPTSPGRCPQPEPELLQRGPQPCPSHRAPLAGTGIPPKRLPPQGSALHTRTPATVVASPYSQLHWGPALHTSVASVRGPFSYTIYKNKLKMD